MQYLLTPEEYEKLKTDEATFNQKVESKVTDLNKAYKVRLANNIGTVCSRHAVGPRNQYVDVLNLSEFFKELAKVLHETV